MHKLKKIVPYLLIVAVSLIIAIGAYVKLEAGSYNKVGGDHTYLVINRNITAYEPIKETDLSYKGFAVEIPGAITMPAEVVGKIAKHTLLEGWPINKEMLADVVDVDERQLVTIYVDYACSGGAVSGDIVDIYKVYPDKAVQKPERVAQNARVLSLNDSKGRLSGKTGEGILSVSSDINLEVIRLAVRPEEIFSLVPGALPDNAYYVLVVKHEETNYIIQDEQGIEVGGDSAEEVE